MVLLSVVVPTYNEATHIAEFLEEVEAAVQGLDYEIVTVDDNSPDGTHARIEAYAKTHSRVRPVLRPRERGLATAVIEGLRRSQGEYAVVMDSDFQHPPPTIPRLLAAAQAQGADCVVASRFAAGGSQSGFPLPRRVISWGAKQFAVWGLSPVRRFRIRDPVSGFFLVKPARVPLAELRPRGYKILLEILARSPMERVVEVGFEFKNRRAGESKLRLRTQWDYLVHVLGLAWQDAVNRRIATFALVGGSGVLVNLLILALLMETAGWDAWTTSATFRGNPFLWGAFLAAVVSREAAILWNFTWNDWVTFHRERRHAHAGYWHRMGRFHVVSVMSMVAYLVVYYPLFHVGVHYLTAAFFAIALSSFLNYVGNMRWTYARRRDLDA